MTEPIVLGRLVSFSLMATILLFSAPSDAEQDRWDTDVADGISQNPLGGKEFESAGIKAGILTCETNEDSEVENYIFYSKTTMSCEYHAGGALEEYVATSKIRGIDLRFFKSSEVVRFAVFAASNDVSQQSCSLSGEYNGVAASLAFVAGGGTGLFFGAGDQSISLQPSLSVVEAFGVAVGNQALTLEAMSCT